MQFSIVDSQHMPFLMCQAMSSIGHIALYTVQQMCRVMFFIECEQCKCIRNVLCSLALKMTSSIRFILYIHYTFAKQIICTKQYCSTLFVALLVILIVTFQFRFYDIFLSKPKIFLCYTILMPKCNNAWNACYSNNIIWNALQNYIVIVSNKFCILKESTCHL